MKLELNSKEIDLLAEAVETLIQNTEWRLEGKDYKSETLAELETLKLKIYQLQNQ